MVRKRIIRWLAGVILLALVVCTVVSNSVYQASLPRVRTRVVEQEVGDLLDGYERDWNAPSGYGSVRYTNVSPGRYTLMVRSLRTMWLNMILTVILNMRAMQSHQTI